MKYGVIGIFIQKIFKIGLCLKKKKKDSECRGVAVQVVGAGGTWPGLRLVLQWPTMWSRTSTCHQRADCSFHSAGRILCRQSSWEQTAVGGPDSTLWHGRCHLSSPSFIQNPESSKSEYLSATYFNLSQNCLCLCYSRVARIVFLQPYGTCNLWLPCRRARHCTARVVFWMLEDGWEHGVFM